VGGAIDIKAVLNFSKSSDPNPVTGSLYRSSRQRRQVIQERKKMKTTKQKRKGTNNGKKEVEGIS
jgi:hypothetical protein